MSLTRPIPEAARPVVKILRRDVQRPRELPIVCRNMTHLRWPHRAMSCPMGLHPKSSCSSPELTEDFAYHRTPQEGVEEFANWWDAQTDPQAAMDAVWPREEEAP